MKSGRIPKRLKRFLSNLRLLDTLTRVLTDPRRTKGRRWSFHYLVELLFTGALVQCPTLTQVERISEQMGLRVPDSTLSYTLTRLDPAPLRAVLRKGVRDMLRSK